MIKITVDTSGARKTLAAAEVAVARARVSALNRVATTARAEAARLIAKRRGLKIGTVKEQILIRRASRALDKAEIVVHGKPISLRDYAARQTRKGVSVVVTKGQRKRVKVAGNAAFQIQRLGQHVFVRTGKARLPIRKLFGPSLPSTFTQEAISSAVIRAAREAWPKRFAEAVAYELRRAGVKK